MAGLTAGFAAALLTLVLILLASWAFGFDVSGTGSTTITIPDSGPTTVTIQAGTP